MVHYDKEWDVLYIKRKNPQQQKHKTRWSSPLVAIQLMLFKRMNMTHNLQKKNLRRPQVITSSRSGVFASGHFLSGRRVLRSKIRHWTSGGWRRRCTGAAVEKTKEGRLKAVASQTMLLIHLRYAKLTVDREIAWSS